ncbi:MAG: DUF948 domain-containing protein [Oscillospiraceae bacterium]
MSEWMVVTVIATLVGLCATVIRPLMSLNSTITRLTEIVKALEKNISGLTEKNSEAHSKLWERVDEHDDVLARHETRLMFIESNSTKGGSK